MCHFKNEAKIQQKTEGHCLSDKNKSTYKKLGRYGKKQKLANKPIHTPLVHSSSLTTFHMCSTGAPLLLLKLSITYFGIE